MQPTPPILLVVSSLAAAGPSPHGRLRRESDPACPVSNYGRSKRAGELAAAQFADRVPLTIVRPPVVFGEGDPAMLSMFRPIKWLRVHVVPGFTEHRASMLHAADLAAGLIAAAQRGERIVPESTDGDSRGHYFFAADVHPTFAEWGWLIARSLGRRRVQVVRAPEFLGWGLACGSEAWSRLRRPHIFSVDKLREATAGSWVCDADRAHRELGFSVAADLETQLLPDDALVPKPGVDLGQVRPEAVDGSWENWPCSLRPARGRGPATKFAATSKVQEPYCFAQFAKLGSFIGTFGRGVLSLQSSAPIGT